MLLNAQITSTRCLQAVHGLVILYRVTVANRIKLYN